MKIISFASIKCLAATLGLILTGASAQAVNLYVTLDSPTNGASFQTSCGAETITITATAFYGGVQSGTNAQFDAHEVVFYANGVEIGVDYTASAGHKFSLVWSNFAAGTYELRVRAYNAIEESYLYSTANTITITSPDSDGDGLSNCDEVNVYHTNPNNSDSDNDGLADGDELYWGADPNNSDTDGDGLSDGSELYSNPYGTSPTSSDTDGDGLSDQEQFTYGTDPTNSDTDGDGWSDSSEINNSTDPLNYDSHP